MGPSGTGKTTLLRLIMGEMTPSSGRVRLFGQDVAMLKRERLYALRQRVGLLFQNGALLTDLSVFENVAFPVREHAKLPEPVLRELVLMKLQAVGLRGAAELMPAELSGGMARRVALARAIVMDPEVLIYDEPFVGLDPISMGVIARLIESLNHTLAHHQHRGIARRARDQRHRPLQLPAVRRQRGGGGPAGTAQGRERAGRAAVHERGARRTGAVSLPGTGLLRAAARAAAMRRVAAPGQPW